MILYCYLAVAFILLVSYLLRIESCQFDLRISRSRETKALMKRKIDKSIQDIKLVLIWPLLLYRLVIESINAIKDSKL